MNIDKIVRQIEDSSVRVESLRRRLGALSPGPDSAMQDAGRELATTLEDLRVAQEAMRQQNEDLSAAMVALEAERERYRDLFESAPGAYAVTDATGQIREANRAAAMLLNTPQKFLVKKPLPLFVPDGERRRFSEALAKVVELRRVQEWECTMIGRRQGREFPAAITAQAVRTGDGTVTGVRWLIRDMTESKRAEAALREANDGSEHRAPARTDELTRANEHLQTEIRERGKAEAELSSRRDRLEELVRERTAELEATHTRLRGADRMAAIGTLAAGLGHDMGNLLLPMRAGVEAMQAAKLPAPLNENLRAIGQAAEYLQMLTNGLNLLARESDEPAPGGSGGRRGGGETDLHAWWPNVASLLKYGLPRRVSLVQRFDPATPGVRVAPHRLTQAVLNLVNNAGNALRERGTGRVTVGATPTADGAHVRVVVADDGPGMTDEVRRRAVEPFFSTGRSAASTGLGLSLVHGIVTEAGGSMEIESEPGVGATAVLTLPAVEASESGERRAEPVPMIAAVSVEDKRAVHSATGALQMMGFTVRSAPPDDPGEASVWVTQESPGAAAAARRFLSVPGRRVVVVGGAPDAWTIPGAVVVDAACRPASIREAMRPADGARRAG